MKKKEWQYSLKTSIDNIVALSIELLKAGVWEAPIFVCIIVALMMFVIDKIGYLD